MEKVRFSKVSFGKKPLLVILASILLLTAALPEMGRSGANETDKQKVVRQVAQKWIQVGSEQYSRGLYKPAEQSFLRAMDYQEYLTAAERDKLSGFLDKAHTAVLERQLISEHIQSAKELVEQSQLTEAKAHLEAVKDNEFLTEEERKLVEEGLASIGGQLGGQGNEIAELYKHSVELYRAGQIEEAREGFAKVAKSKSFAAPAGQTAEDYLVMINTVLDQKAKAAKSTQTEAPKPVKDTQTTDSAAIEVEVVAVKPRQPQKVELKAVQDMGRVSEAVVVEPVPEEDDYIKMVNRRKSILQGHTRAVVNDAIGKSENYISQGEFEKAKEAIEAAERTVNANRLGIGDYLFNQHSNELIQQTEKIIQGQNARDEQSEEARRTEAIRAQEDFRKQMEVDREKRVADLLDNAVAYQKQQRYEEALGQLEILLAINPLHNQALILKDTLVDVINFRQQLEVQKEADRERTGIIRRTDESGIPYADEISYPKSWREISAKRKPEGVIGQDPADAAVYRQLDEIVDLSQLSPEMPLSEAIDELRNAVEPPLQIIVLWRDLTDNADIDQTTAIQMNAITAIPLSGALESLLKSVSGGLAEIGYTVKNGIITIATIESLPEELEPRVYDVTLLLGQPAYFQMSGYGGGGRGGGGEIGGGGRGGGGMGGGGMRGGGCGGGGMGGGQFYAEYFYEQDQIMDRTELEQEADDRATNLVTLVQETIEPDSWFDAGGEGTIMVYENKKLVVRQTRKIHNQIEKLIKDMRKSLGYQVAIEARFLVVGENFLEDIGLDLDFKFMIDDNIIDVQQGSSDITKPQSTGVRGSLGPTVDTPIIGAEVEGGFGNMAPPILDDLEVTFLLRAVQGHRDSKSLNAPKVTVLSGESAIMRVQRTIRFPLVPNVGQSSTALGVGGGTTSTNLQQNYGEILTGTVLSITPSITPDKKHVLLNIITELRDFLGFETTDVSIPNLATPTAAAGPNQPSQVITYPVTLPQTEISRVQTRVNVPDRGTLLLGGQKVTVEIETEAGVPVLSKIPLLGRLFSNRSKIKDHKILLILVKPTIILQEEKDAEAIAGMESVF